MILEKITCSDMREYNTIEDFITFGKLYPNAEFAIQAHPPKFYKYQPRYEWTNTFATACKVNNINMALHINGPWRDDMCSNGIIAPEVKHLMDLRRDNGGHVIGRIQININGGNQEYMFNANRVADIIREYPDIEFIFQYTPAQYERVTALDKTGAKFSLLYDASGGRGKTPDEYHGPVMQNHKMGYSGGISPENVEYILNRVNMVLPSDYVTWIDAEKKLQNPYTGRFDVARALEYVRRANNWIHRQR